MRVSESTSRIIVYIQLAKEPGMEPFSRLGFLSLYKPSELSIQGGPSLRIRTPPTWLKTIDRPPIERLYLDYQLSGSVGRDVRVDAFIHMTYAR